LLFVNLLFKDISLTSSKFKYKFLDKKIDIDTIIDIENRK